MNITTTRISSGSSWFFRALFVVPGGEKLLPGTFKICFCIMCPTRPNSLARETSRRSDLRSAFDVLDVDRDGKISPDDLRTFYGGYLATTSSEEDFIDSMISVADANKDGFVEYEEFEKVLGSRKNAKKNSGNLMEDVFRVIDKDGDGRVGYEDLKSYLTFAGFDATDDDVTAMIRLAGGDQNCGVTYEALLRVLAI